MDNQLPMVDEPCWADTLTRLTAAGTSVSPDNQNTTDEYGTPVDVLVDVETADIAALLAALDITADKIDHAAAAMHDTLHPHIPCPWTDPTLAHAYRDPLRGIARLIAEVLFQEQRSTQPRFWLSQTKERVQLTLLTQLAHHRPGPVAITLRDLITLLSAATPDPAAQGRADEVVHLNANPARPWTQDLPPEYRARISARTDRAIATFLSVPSLGPTLAQR